MAVIKLIDAETAAVNSDRFEVTRVEDRTTIFATGLAGVETVTVQFSQDEGVSWTTLIKDGSNVELSTNDNSVTVYGVGTFRLNKGITGAPVTCTLHTFKAN